MANLKEVRTRIASVTSTQQITSAMKMVSAAKFRKAQLAIMGMRPYAQMVSEIIADINMGERCDTPYHTIRNKERVLMVVVTSNKGLCGGFNSSVIKQANARIAYWKEQNIKQVHLIAIGKKAIEAFSKQDNLVIETYDELLDHPEFDAIYALSDSIMERFTRKEYDHVELVYNRFKNSITQDLTTEQYLPIPDDCEKEERQAVNPKNDFIFEPNKEEIIQELVPFMLHTQFYRMILDSLAAEHGARMTAMQSATDNATQLLAELRLTYNKVRQASITNEIIEIVSGSEALKN